MLTANCFAFKEWAVTCKALETGRQSVLLRKGGIHERGGRFEVEHGEFWLFPTRFHQNPEEIRPEARPLLQEVANEAPSPACVRLSLYAVVDEVYELTDASLLPRLAGLQILADDTLLERFHYRRPALRAHGANLSTGGADRAGRITTFRRLPDVGRSGTRPDDRRSGARYGRCRAQ